MKIILDTNIWYDIETNDIFKKEDLKKNITVTFLNYFELIKNPRIVTQPDLFRKIFSKMDEYERTFEPPYVHIAKLHKFYHYNVLTEQQDYIKFLVSYKNGDYIDPNKVDEFQEFINNMNKDFENLANWYNESALTIKSKIKNNKKHLALDSSKFTNEYIQTIVTRATKKNLDDFDFNNIDLFSSTLDRFFRKLEVGELVMKTNDIIDYMLLSYVQPGDLYYTQDKKWLKLINSANKGEYLYINGI